MTPTFARAGRHLLEAQHDAAQDARGDVLSGLG